jgi:hypothetical protein
MTLFLGTKIHLSNFNVVSFKNLIDYRGLEPQRCISYDQTKGIYQFSSFILPGRTDTTSRTFVLQINNGKDIYCSEEQAFFRIDGSSVNITEINLNDSLLGLKSLTEPKQPYIVTLIHECKILMPMCKVLIPEYKNFALACGIFAKA